VPPLVEALEDKDPDVRCTAATTLGRIGPEAVAAVPLLTEMLKAPVGQVRVSASLSLWAIAKKRAALSTLGLAVRDSDASVRYAAIASLGEIGAEASPCVPSLIEALKDPDEANRNAAVRALGRIGPNAVAALPALIAALKRTGEGSVLPADVIETLRRMNASAVPGLVRVLGEKGDEKVLSTVAEALGLMGPHARAAVPVLVELLRNQRDLLRVTTALAIWRIAKCECAVPILTGALDAGDDAVRWAAARALAEIGPSAKSAVRALSRGLKGGDVYDREYAATALGCIGPGAKEAVGVLTMALKDREYKVRIAAAVALWRINHDQVSVSALVKSVKSDDDLERERALEGLAAIGPAAKAATPVLLEALQGRDGSVVAGAARALGNIGPDAKRAVPLLIRALTDGRPFVPERAEEALKRIDPVAAANAGLK
jgi:HEAT repeat protein